MAAVVAGLLAMACSAVGTPPEAVTDFGCSYGYSLEVVNDARESVRVRMDLQAFSDVPVIVLESGERRTYRMSTGWLYLGGMCSPVPEPSEFVKNFFGIRFYDEGSEDPFRTYYYPTRRCGDVACSDESFMHRSYESFVSSDDRWERLFVESPDRPFYLDRDEEDPELARIVITFVPSAEPVGRTSLQR